MERLMGTAQPALQHANLIEHNSIGYGPHYSEHCSGDQEDCGKKGGGGPSRWLLGCIIHPWRGVVRTSCVLPSCFMHTLKRVQVIEVVASDSLNNQVAYELIQQLRELPTGDGKAYEGIVKDILEYCFRGEFDFSPFEVQEQVVTYNGKRIRDFIIDNRYPKMGFWRDLKYVRKVEKILFDAKNYKDPITYSEIASTIRYLHRNKAFGNFIIIISR